MNGRQFVKFQRMHNDDNYGANQLRGFDIEHWFLLNSHKQCKPAVHT